MYGDIQEREFDEVWRKLYNETLNGWSPKHIQLCEHLIKGQPFFEKLWDMEHESKVN
jgi:hypothetical protein